MRRACATLVIMLGVCIGASGQDIYARYNGSCQQGGAPSTTNGINSQQDVQLSYPFCTITVFNHGTLVQASIFSDAAGTLPIVQPIVATSTGSFGFYAANGRYDALLSGGGLPSSFTISDITLCFTTSCGGGGGGGTPGGSTTQFQFNDGGSFNGASGLTYTKTSAPPETDVGSFDNIQYVLPSYSWSQTPGGTLTGGTPATVTLTPCPYGVNGVSDTIGEVYISNGTGTAEPVILAGGGTCTSLAASGTIKFTPQNSHSGSWTVGSASSGIYEALSGVTNWSGSTGNTRLVLRPGGTSAGNFTIKYDIYGSVHAPLNNVTIDAHGAILDCHTRDFCFVGKEFGPLRIIGGRFATDQSINGWAISSTQCTSSVTTITTTATHGILVGDSIDVQWTDNHHYWGGSVSTGTTVSAVTSNTIQYTDTNCGGSPGTSISLATTPGYVNVVNAFFLAANTADELVDVIQSNPGGISGHFNNGVVILNDQAFKMDGTTIGLSSTGTTKECTSTNPYCGWSVYAPGPFVNAAVVWIVNSNISPNCNGNGIGYFAGNTMGVSNTVIQGYPQWGILTGNVRGGFGRTATTNVYEEQGSCTNPVYPSVGTGSGGTGIMTIGTPTSINGGEGPAGGATSFASGGATTYYYYIVAHDSVLGTSVPLAAGSAAPSGTSVTVQWPRIVGTNTITYDILRATSNIVSPATSNCTGGTTTACGSVATAQVQCSTLICSFTDNVSSNTTSYTVTDPPTYAPFLWFWPAAMMAETSGADSATSSIFDCGGSFHLTNFTIAVSGLSNIGSYLPCVFADFAPGGGSGNAPEWIQSLESSVNMATVLNMNKFTSANKKGRLVFSRRTGSTVPAGEILTLVDNSPANTFADTNYNPATDSSDMYIGNDQAGASLNAVGMSLNAPVSITNYIVGAKVETVNSTKKEILLPTQVDQGLTLLAGCSFGCGPFNQNGTQVSGFGTGSNFTAINGTMTFTTGTVAWASDGTGGEAASSWTANTFNANQFSQATVATTGGSQNSFVCVHASNVAATLPKYCYGGGSGTFLITKVSTLGVYNSLVGSLPSLSPGDIILLQATQNASTSVTLTAFQNGVQVAQVTDSSSPILGGYAGVSFQHGGSLKLFIAGDLSWTTSQLITVNNTFKVTSGTGTITMTPTTVGALPSAASNSGAIITVSDSTPVATEGQTCVGSSGNVALAFSNGSTWSCFSAKAGGTAAGLTGTGACATITTQTGGAFSGQATCTGSTAASTLTITPGTTAPNGWVCYVQDQTTRANLLQQTANNGTTCTLTATSITSNDVFVFTATPF